MTSDLFLLFPGRLGTSFASGLSRDSQQTSVTGLGETRADPARPEKDSNLRAPSLEPPAFEAGAIGRSAISPRLGPPCVASGPSGHCIGTSQDKLGLTQALAPSREPKHPNAYKARLSAPLDQGSAR